MISGPEETFGHFRMIRMLGKGGMGEVFLAEDTALSRKVALKRLPGKSTAGEQIERFRQEARSASALNHPNIITVYEIGDIAGTLFIATEFIQGVTLREKIVSGDLTLREVLEIAVQVSSALSAAHEAGIVHRDIKPENIMVRPDGYVKVLDFGLAKLSRAETSQDSVTTVVLGSVHTTPGMIMGTAQYMSPEQARGIDVDARSDIFSLGVVLYELVAKQPPFTGATAHHQIVAILEQDPPPISQIVPEAPAELERILGKMLAKDRDSRYQNTKDLALDLKELRRTLELEAEVRRRNLSVPGISLSGQFRVPSSGFQAPDQPVEAASVASGSSPGQQSTAPESAGVSADEPGIAPAKTRGVKRMVAFAAGFLILLAGGALIAKRFWPAVQPGLWRNISLQQLTESGGVGDAVISPEGRYVVYTESERGLQSLKLRQISTGSDVNIQEPFAGSYQGLTFSPDGDFVYFVKPEPGADKNMLYRVPSLGGSPTKVLEDVDSAITISPDRKRFVFSRWITQSDERQLLAASFAGGSEQKLLEIKLPAYATSAPAWSPDGKWIAFCVHNTDPTGSYGLIKVIPSGGGAAKIVGPRWTEAVAAAWLPGSRGLLIAAAQAGIDSQQIWYVPFPSGSARRLTNDLNSYSAVSVTADGKSILTVKDEIVARLCLQATDNPGGERDITNPGPRHEGAKGISWTPDGKLIYTAKATDGADLYIRELKSDDARQLTSQTASIQNPQVTGDNRYIIFASNRNSNVWHIWRYDRQDGGFKQLTNGNGEMYGTVSPDGKTLVYVELDKDGLWKQSIDGGSPSQVTAESDEYPVFSPDGKLLAYSFADPAQKNRTRIGIRPVDGGPPDKVFDFAMADAHDIEWVPNGSAVSYVCERNGISQIFVQKISGGAPRQITDLQNCSIFRYAWSPDGKRLAMSRGNLNSDVVLFRQAR